MPIRLHRRPAPAEPVYEAEPVELDYGTADATAPGRWVVLPAVLASACCVAGTIAAWVDVESVVLSGPALFVLGLALAVAAGRRRLAAWAAVGGAHMAVCALFLALVNLLGWGPAQAQRPLSIMAAAYTMLAVSATAVLLWRAPR